MNNKTQVTRTASGYFSILETPSVRIPTDTLYLAALAVGAVGVILAGLRAWGLA